MSREPREPELEDYDTEQEYLDALHAYDMEMYWREQEYHETHR